MGFVERAVGMLAEARSGVTSAAKPAAWLLDALGGSPTHAGTRVSEATATRVSAVFACVRVIAESVSSLPLPLYERLPRGRRRATEHPLYRLIHTTPNPEQPSAAFRELLTGHIALWGDAFAEVERNGRGEAINFWPLLPGMTRAIRKGGVKYAVTTLPSGKQGALRPGQYIHIPGPSWLRDGLSGHSPIREARQAIGLALAAEESGSRFFGQGARPSGVLYTDKRLSDQARKRLVADWRELNEGISNANRTALLEENLKWQQISVNPDNAQSLETRKFQVEEIARLYRIPLVLLGHTEKATSWGTGIEQFMLGFVVHTLRPWLNRWEEWVPHHLMAPEERSQFYLEHVIEELLKGDIAARYTAYATAAQNGWMNRNEIRERENLNPIDGKGGDAYTVQLNMITLDDLVGGDDGLDDSPDSPAMRALRATLQRAVEHDQDVRALPPAPDAQHSEVKWVDGIRVEAVDGERWRLTLQDAAGLEQSVVVNGVDGSGATNEARRYAAAIERGRRSVRARHRLQRRFLAVFQEAFGPVVRREAEAIREILDELPEDTSASAFTSRVSEFYEGGHEDYLEREFLAVLTPYAELVQAEVVDEVALDEPPPEADLAVWGARYVARFFKRHAARSVNQLSVLAERVAQEGLRDAIEQRLEEWEETRPAKLAQEESVHSGGAVSRMTYFAAGIMGLQWITFGENCPLCDELNGQIVGIQEAFVGKDETVDPDDGETAPLTTRHAILHGPLHLGCDCGIVAAIL